MGHHARAEWPMGPGTPALALHHEYSNFDTSDQAAKKKTTLTRLPYLQVSELCVSTLSDGSSCKGPCLQVSPHSGSMLGGADFTLLLHTDLQKADTVLCRYCANVLPACFIAIGAGIFKSFLVGIERWGRIKKLPWGGIELGSPA